MKTPQKKLSFKVERLSVNKRPLKKETTLYRWINLSLMGGLIYVLKETFFPQESVESIQLTALTFYGVCLMGWWFYLQQEEKASVLTPSTLEVLQSSSVTAMNVIHLSEDTLQPSTLRGFRWKSKCLHLSFLLLGSGFSISIGQMIVHEEIPRFYGFSLLGAALCLVFLLYREVYRALHRQQRRLKRFEATPSTVKASSNVSRIA